MREVRLLLKLLVGFIAIIRFPNQKVYILLYYISLYNETRDKEIATPTKIGHSIDDRGINPEI
tara:strand:+ start:286 stop:474 length:189 start_codon:yes stop_codon:yes gene_type:complete